MLNEITVIATSKIWSGGYAACLFSIMHWHNVTLDWQRLISTSSNKNRVAAWSKLNDVPVQVQAMYTPSSECGWSPDRLQLFIPIQDEIPPENLIRVTLMVVQVNSKLSKLGSDIHKPPLFPEEWDLLIHVDGSSRIEPDQLQATM